jgi:hypothetical protein
MAGQPAKGNGARSARVYAAAQQYNEWGGFCKEFYDGIKRPLARVEQTAAARAAPASSTNQTWSSTMRKVPLGMAPHPALRPQPETGFNGDDHSFDFGH